MLEGRAAVFRAITILRKICNHPDLMLLDRDPVRAGHMDNRLLKRKDVAPVKLSEAEVLAHARAVRPDFGNVSRSGKLQVVSVM